MDEPVPKARFHLSFKAVVFTISMIIMATIIGEIVHAVLAISPVNIVMIYLLAVVITSLRAGYGAAVLASLLGVLSFNFFFIPPELTFHVEDGQYLITFLGLFSIGLVIADLNTRARIQTEAAYRREQQTELLREKEKLQSTLLNSISHDLRTPLVSITGALGSLKDNSHLIHSAAGHELIEAAYEEAERLNRLVGNLLDMSRLQAGSLRLKREFYDVQEIITVARSQLRERLEKREIQISMEPNLPLLFVDLVLFAQVLVNLLDNAAKYSPIEKPIEIRAYQNKSAVIIEVADRGIGIPEEELAYIFEKFYRSSTVDERKGSGLGLSICQGLVELHGGSIHAENRKAGGARFLIYLPLEQAQTLPDSTSSVLI